MESLLTCAYQFSYRSVKTFFLLKRLYHILAALLQDLVVGYMGVPKYNGISMTQHPQYVTVRYVEAPE